MHSRPAKRKVERRQSPIYEQPDPALYIQAHEAEVIRGPQAQALALTLEAEYADKSRNEVQTRLVIWEPPSAQTQTNNHIWVDRYDARLLLDTLPTISASDSEHTAGAATGRLSPTGWSDLPSDTEDTFFFSPDEVEDYHRDKRTRFMEQSRQERLRTLRAETGEDDEPEDQWGGSDEEPDDAQKSLMRRTATHILSSPNPAQLEMRILANHGADKRFAFLRGRWSRAWKITKRRAHLDLEAEKVDDTVGKQSKVGLGGLAGYGDSDASEDEAGSDNNDATEVTQDVSEASSKTLEDAAKEARRARAREWAEKRRAKQTSDTQ